MLKTVLVALDELDESAQIMEMVQHIQLDVEAQLVFAHVLYSEPIDIASDRPPADIVDLRALYSARLEAQRASLPWASSVEVVWGDPAEEIVRLAYLYTADLIVMGTRGLTGVSRVLQGSVSSQVVANAPCSVLVVKLNQQTSKP